MNAIFVGVSSRKECLPAKLTHNMVVGRFGEKKV
jgi:hypothetical protein